MDSEKGSEPGRPLHRRIRAISVWPTLLTLGNLICGFAAIHFCVRSDEGFSNPALVKLFQTNLAVACYLVYLAMLFDTLDGRVARFSRMTSDFGGQLDSLADVVSFGAAPAVIAVKLIRSIAANQLAEGDVLVSPIASTAYGRFCWMACASYLAFAALRLARFNVENLPDESAHVGFRGLPSPGAAGALVSLVLLDDEVIRPISSAWVDRSNVLAGVVPTMAIILGLLMVSRVPYVHLVNRYLRGKKPFWVLPASVVGLVAFFLRPQLVLAVAFCGYAVSGPLLWVLRRIRHHPINPASQE